MMIEIERYPVFMRLGVFREEQAMGQEVLVSLKAEIQIHSLTHIQDELSHTLDYGLVLTALDQLIGGSQCRLVETALNKVGEGLMSRFPLIQSLDLKIEKPVLPRNMGKGAHISVRHLFLRK